MKQQGNAPHLAAPRTLLFLERAGRWLFIKGAAYKWWAGKLNGIGGSVEADEDILSAARRETQEETGLLPARLELAAVVHVTADPAVLLFVYTGTLPPGELSPCDEGTFCWLAPDAIHDPARPFMPDLPFLLPRLWARDAGQAPLYYHFDFSAGFTVREGGEIRFSA